MTTVESAARLAAMAQREKGQANTADAFESFADSLADLEAIVSPPSQPAPEAA